MAKRYQRSNQNLKIKQEQTTQWPKDTKGVIRICKSNKKRQHNGQKKKDKQPSTKHTHKTSNTNPTKNWGIKVSSSWSTSGTCHVNLVTNPVISHE